MLKIGEFSRLSQVTVKTLHHYDELGLIKPAHIDPVTNYRYYEVEQLPRIHRIMALKEFGLSLEQIGIMLDEDLPTEQIRGMLRLKQAEIHQDLREGQRQLAMVEFRLRMIDAEDDFPKLDVVMKSLKPIKCLSFFDGPHPNLTEEEGLEYRGRVVNSIQKAIADGVIKYTGVSLDVFHGETIIPFSSPDLHERQHEILLGVMDSQESVTIEGIGQLTIRDEPAIETAATLFLNLDSESSPSGHVEKSILLRRWTIAHGYQPHDRIRYYHHRGLLDTSNSEEFVIEAQLPVDTGD